MSRLNSLMVTMRPKQWTKNLVVYLALVFTINLYWAPRDFTRLGELLGRTTIAFILFCLLSGSVYLINDVTDLESDRQHPQKRKRPIASGQLQPSQAIAASILLVLASLAIGFWLTPTFGVISLIYFIIMLAYSLKLKHVVIIDVFTIAAGFVLRVVAGAVVIGVPISPWLYICTILGALFLGISKRRHELVLLNNNASEHRPILAEYTPKLLDEMIAVVTSSTVIAYSLYTFSAENLPRNHAMMLTIPFVIYGIFRYLYLIHSKNLGGSPEEALFTDIPLIIDIALWLLTAMGILVVYRGH